MGKDVALGCRKQMCRNRVVDPGSQRRNAGRATGERLEDLLFTLMAVSNQALHSVIGLVDRLTVPGQEAAPSAFRQTGKRSHVGTHIPVRWRDDRG